MIKNLQRCSAFFGIASLLILGAGYSNTSAQVPSAGLVGMYPMEGNGNDVSSAGNNLLFTGTASDPTFGIDRFGNEMSAMHFNGAQFANMPDMNLGNNFTITMWLKSEVVNVRMPISGANYPNQSFQFLDLSVTGGSADGTAFFLFRAFDGSYDAESGPMTSAISASTPALLENDWYFVAMRNNNGTISLQIDGTIYPMQNQAAAMNSLQMVLGKRAGAGSYEFQGFIDDLTIHNSALSNEDLETIRATEIVEPPKAWTIGIRAYSSNSNDQSASFGVAEHATTGFDAELDIPAAPGAPGNSTRVVFPKPDFQSPFGDDFRTDVRAIFDWSTSYVSWDPIISSSENGEVTFFFDVPLALSGARVEITNLATGETVLASAGNYYTGTFNTAQHSSVQFHILVGRDNTAPVVNPRVGALTENAILRAQDFVNGAFDASAVNRLTSLTAELSINGGQSWETTPILRDGGTKGKVGKEKGDDEFYRFSWQNSEDFNGNRNLSVRITAVDRFENTTVFNSQNTLILASSSQEVSINEGWNLVGVPFASLVGGKAEQFAGELNNYFVSYDWNGTNYVSTNEIVSGTGFWLGTLQPASAIATGEISITEQTKYLPGGWSIISNPLVTPANVSGLRFYYTNGDFTSETFSYNDAITNGLISPVYEYNRVNGNYDEASVASPFSGQWIGTFMANVFVIWSPSFNQPSAEKSSSGITNALKDSRLLSLTGRDKDGVLSFLSIGFDESATNGFDTAFDKLLPPMPPKGNGSSLEGAQTPLGKRFGTLVFKGDELVRTKMNVEGANGEAVTLSWSGGTFEGSAKLITSTGSFDLTTAGSVTVLVGDNVSIELSPSATSIENGKDLPTAFALGQNYPNPFNPSTSISFDVPQASDVKLSVFNMLGQEVAVLVNGRIAAGSHSATFDASKLSSGVYLYRLQSGSFSTMKKMTLMK